MRLGRVALIAILLGALALSAGARSSGAVFVAASPQAADTFSAAADFNTVVASLSDPGTPLRGTVSLSASATSDRGIATVVFQSSPAGAGTWSTICTVASAPYTCNFNTTAVADGLRDVRIVATDSAGYSKTPTIANRRVDNTAPASGMTNPGTPLRGTVTLNATGSDGGSGLASLTIQRSPAGAGTWTTVCTTATSPASCSLDTTTVADGLYDLRATATDAAGNATTSTVTSRRIDNTAPTVTMTDPGASVAGTITLQSTNADAGSGVATVAYQYRTSPAGAWTSACSAASSCSWSTASVADGLYDFRATATDGAGNATTSAVISSRRIDNTVPSSATMVDPGTPLSGTVALSGTAADAGSGVATLLFQYAPAGTSTWATACSSAASPYGCNWDTTAIADGVYDMRALATDGAGNQLASATRSNRRVDNVAPAVSLTDPGSPLRATRTLTATAGDGGGIANVVIARKTSAGSTWTTICTAVASPYTCSWNTTGVTDGSYDLRAVATDNAGRTNTSIVANRVVDNTAPAASTITATNSGTVATLSTGDTISLGYSEAPAPASILTGWTGTSRAVTLTFITTALTTSMTAVDTASGTSVALGTVTISDKLTKATGTDVSATMVLSGSSLTLTLGTIATPANLKAGTNPMTLDWTIPAGTTDIAGNASTANTVSGSGNL